MRAVHPRCVAAVLVVLHSSGCYWTAVKHGEWKGQSRPCPSRAYIGLDVAALIASAATAFAVFGTDVTAGCEDGDPNCYGTDDRIAIAVFSGTLALATTASAIYGAHRQKTTCRSFESPPTYAQTSRKDDESANLPRAGDGEITNAAIPGRDGHTVLLRLIPEGAPNELLDLSFVVESGIVAGPPAAEVNVSWGSQHGVPGIASIEIVLPKGRIDLRSRVREERGYYLVFAEADAQTFRDPTIATDVRFLIWDRVIGLTPRQQSLFADFLGRLPKRADGMVATAHLAETDAAQRASAHSDAPIEPPTPAKEPPSEPKLVATGTCFAVSPNGLLITNHHVIADADKVFVQFDGKDVVPAQVRATSLTNDLAVLLISSKPPGFLPLATSKNVRRGDRIFTVGFPVPNQLGWEPKYSEGSISALSARGEASMMQTSIPVQGGNSGGAVVTESGVAIGVMRAKMDAKYFIEGSGELPEAISFAIKSDYVLPLTGKLPTARRAKTRREAVRRTEQATCRVFAVQDRGGPD